MIVSTGGATIEDVDRAVETIAPINEQICLLQCTAAYPAAVEELNLGVITTLRERSRTSSSASPTTRTASRWRPVAYMLGARVIEKHFTLEPRVEGHRPRLLADARGMRKLVRDLRRVPAAMGDGVKRPLPSEELPLKKMGKKLVAARELVAGHVLVPGDLAARRRRTRAPAVRARRAARRAARSSRAAREDEAILEHVDAAGAGCRDAVTPPRDDELVDRARRLRLRRRLHRQPRLGDTRTATSRSLLARRRDRPAAPRRGRASRRGRLDRAEPGRRAPGAKAPRALRPRRRGQARRASRGVGGARASASTRSPTSGTTSTTPRASQPSACPSSRPTHGRRSPLARWVLERPGGRGCVREVCDAIWRALRGDPPWTSSSTSRAASPSSPAAWASSGRRSPSGSPSVACASRSSTSRPRRAPAPPGSRPRSRTASVRALACDVTDRRALEAALALVEADWGVPHLLVNAAAIDAPPDAPADRGRAVRGRAARVARARRPRQRRRRRRLLPGRSAARWPRAGRGSIVNVGSVYGLLSPDQGLYDFRRDAGETFFKPVAYSVSKSALLNLTRYLATYWGRSGVRVNTLTPHGIENGQPEPFVEAFAVALAARPADGRLRGARRASSFSRPTRRPTSPAPTSSSTEAGRPGDRRRGAEPRRGRGPAPPRTAPGSTRPGPPTAPSSAGVARSGAEDAAAAVAAAREAQPAWAARTAVERGNVVRAIAELLRERRDEASELVAAETGQVARARARRDGRRGRDGALRRRRGATLVRPHDDGLDAAPHRAHAPPARSGSRRS